MKKAFKILAAAAIVLSAVACSSAKKMAELAENVIVTCNPAVLEAEGHPRGHPCHRL